MLSTACAPLASVPSAPFPQSLPSIEIDSSFEGIDFYTSPTRVDFESLYQDLFRFTFEPVEKSCPIKVNKSQVHEIVLARGSTRIPRIVKLVSDSSTAKPNKSINPDEAVAYDATDKAGILVGDTSEQTSETLLLVVAPLSLGIETTGGV